MRTRRRLLRTLTAAGVLAAFVVQAGWAASLTRTKNIIVMIADGSGANAIVATGLYTGKLGKQIFDGPAWVKSWASTYPLRENTKPIPGVEGLAQNPGSVYDPAKSWDPTPVIDGPLTDHFSGYRWNKQHAPDSADTMSAIVTGHKTYPGAINVDGNGNKLDTLAERARREGKAVGVVTTVQISDATPAAGGGAHNVSRANRTEIASEMLSAGTLSVIMGTGNPDYDDNGARLTMPAYTWIGAKDWTSLKTGTHPGGFRLIQDRGDFDALPQMKEPPLRLVGVARSFNSTQQDRAGATPDTEAPFSVPRKTDVPSLTTMVLGALHILSRDPDGLFLVIEGGAVDRAMHNNNLGRMIEERMEFDDAVAAVSRYLETNSEGNNWSNTLVLVTADHDHLLYGPDSDTIPFQDLKDNGAGKMPGYRWQHTSHSNQLVPLFARGPGAQMVLICADQRDAHTDFQGRKFGHGLYLDQTELFGVMSAYGHCS